MLDHTSIQLGNVGEVSRVRYEAKAGTKMFLESVSPLLLAFSVKQLPGGTVDLSKVTQLLSAFAWNPEQSTAEFLMPIARIEKNTHLFVTAIVLGSNGPVVIGKPECLEIFAERLLMT